MRLAASQAWQSSENRIVMTQPSQLSRMGFVLAGGRSSRMGTDKAFLKLGDRTLLERGISALRSVCPDVAIVGDRGKFSAHGTVIEDIYRGAGPLAGIHAALQHSSADLNLILAVDLPFVSTKLLGFLFASAERTDAVVTVTRTASGFQPLCAVYRRPFAIAADHALRAGKNKIDVLFAGLATRIIDEGELRAAGFSEKVFSNLNTPEDVQAVMPDLLRG
jgi:molybdopterin-guanine dinucleotide biosynthesis protein A